MFTKYVFILFCLSLLFVCPLLNRKHDQFEFFTQPEAFHYDANIHEPNKLQSCTMEGVQCVEYKNKGLTIIKEDKPYLFIHIPKNAGTYIRKMMPGLNDNHDHAPLRDIQTKHPKLYNKNFTFAVVRNPWERCVSMFNFHMNTNEMDIKGWGNYGMDILNKHKVHTFEDFVQLLYNNKENIFKLGEIVWEKQTYFITDHLGRLIVDKIIYIENLEEEINQIKAYYKITIPNPEFRINVSNSKPYKQYYNDFTKAQVAEIYAEDILLTGYTFD